MQADTALITPKTETVIFQWDIFPAPEIKSTR